MLSNLEAAIVQYPLSARADATVLSAVEQMSNLSKQGIDGDNGSSTCVVIVSDELKVLGILTQQDVMRLVIQQQPIAQLTLRQFWQEHRSPSASLIISQSDLKDLRNINAAIAHFESSQITHLAIVDAQEQLVGVLQHETLIRLRDAIIHEATASLFAIQQKIHERIAQSEPLSEVLGELLLMMETYLRGSSCSITLCRDGLLGEVIAPSLPMEYAMALEKANLPIAEGVGSCGTAAFRRELVVVSDIANDPLWQNHKQFALCYGLQACSSIPIFASDRTVLGAFGIYYREQKAPQAQELEWITQAANIAGIAIERDQATQALQQLNQELEHRVQVRTQELQEREQFLQTVLDTFPLSVFWKDVNSVYLGCNQNFLRDAGFQTIAQIIGKTDREMPWGETEADFYRDGDRAIIEGQIPKLAIEDTQHQANGRTIWTEINKLPLRNLQGEVIGVLGTYQDISDRKNAEQKQAKLTAILEATPDYIGMANAQGEILWHNRQLKQLRPELVDGAEHRYISECHPDWVNKIILEQALPTAIEKGSWAGEMALLDSAGKEIPVSQVIIAHRSDSGVVESFSTIMRDISDRKTMELSLKASERRYASLAAAAPVAIFRFDEPLNCVYVNERWSDLSGRPMESALGHGWMESVHPEDREQSIAEWAEYYAHSNPESQIIHGSEGRHLRPDGTTTWVYIQVAKEFDNDGNIVGYIGTLTDITDRKNTELALQDLSDRLEFALKGANIGIWEWQISEGRLLWDERMFNLYGISPEAFSGEYEDWFQSIHPDDQEWVQQAEQQSPQGAKECHVEFRIIRPNGTIRFIDSYVFNQYNAQGEIQKKVGLNIDITDRKQAEIQLQRINEELIKATRLKDEFLANMSHELRTPLNAILGMTEILQEGILGDLNDRQMQSLQTIEKSSNHLLELINDILDVAKVEAGQIKLFCQPCHVETLCQSGLLFIKQQAFTKNIQLETEIPAHLPTINLDERRIRQVLINLLNNAVKFTPDGGKVSIKVNYIAFSDKDAIAHNGAVTCDKLEISIVDTGIGIAPDQIQRLFQPFVQVESALNRSYNGTGLGLALVKRLVELHGGEVRLTSELGVGSCFTIALPITPFCEVAVESAPPLLSSSETITGEIANMPLILLAEDNEANVTMFVEYLSLKGFRLLVAHNGRMAIDLAQQTHPDLILMDIQMPGMDGLEAIQHIRQKPELANTPIIALTALAMSGDRDRCLAAGANDYLSKPVSMKQLVTKINSYLGSINN
ncbi:PAS domain S-box protein [Pseudanabaena sp. FACHB-1277]|uniref:Circadian input-output histidine kinase CikA n=1 Tax=Pseudanabaena cinerea FACHB-1277 TaxID=2949581 RepID=A0A926Z9T0_9CYAN|nr:PAS domain S-box protein [Pseudanabaena cinerea]MBD2152149.1 PAS domain S-box protein [Pseudanabaena cinerea FACHB-1277]